jgi:hypothetical protein
MHFLRFFRDLFDCCITARMRTLGKVALCPTGGKATKTHAETFFEKRKGGAGPTSS